MDELAFAIANAETATGWLMDGERHLLRWAGNDPERTRLAHDVIERIHEAVQTVETSIRSLAAGDGVAA